MHNCKFISSCTIMYVCSYDLHYNVLWGRYAERVNEEITIFPRKISMQNCKSIVDMVFECYFIIISSCIMMYFTRSKRVNKSNFPGAPCEFSGSLFSQFTCFDIGMPALIIISFSRCKRKIICLDRTKTCLSAKFQVHWCYG